MNNIKGIDSKGEYVYNESNKHVETLFYEENKECDMCSNICETVVIGSLDDSIVYVCKKCLENILSEMKED
jgi:hypothetical protein